MTLKLPRKVALWVFGYRDGLDSDDDRFAREPDRGGWDFLPRHKLPTLKEGLRSSLVGMDHCAPSPSGFPSAGDSPINSA